MLKKRKMLMSVAMLVMLLSGNIQVYATNNANEKKVEVITINEKLSLIKYPDGDVYLGEIKNGKPHGHGYKIHSYGSEVIANWVNDSKVGYEIVSWPDYGGANIIMVQYAGDNKPENADYVQIEPQGDVLQIKSKKENNSNPNHKNESVQSNEKLDISTVKGMKQYLQDNYGTLNTIAGETKFTFNVAQNSMITSPWDYWIQVNYKYSFFEGIMMSNKYTTQEKNTLRQQLKAHQEKLAKDIISKVPDKKLYGGYYNSYYKYPNLKMDLQTSRYYSWTNYNEPDYLSKDKYGDTKPSTFRWYDLIDDKL